MKNAILDRSPIIEQLSDGLTIIAQQMPVEAVNLNLWIDVGSALESDEINGMAHFLEHMVFKGTDRLENGEFERLIEEKGAVTNAATSQEYTHYYITTAPKYFAELAPLQLDVVLNPNLAEDAFEREKSVILEEIRRSQDSPSRRSFKLAMETCFESLPYRRPILGKAAIIENLRSQQMRDFHGYYYQPKSLVASVVGNLPAEKLIKIVAEGYELVKGKTISQNQETISKKQNILPAEAPFNSIVRREYSDPKLQQARLILLWRVPGMAELEKTYALDVLAAVLGQGRMSRLFRELREDKKLVDRISASNISQTIQGCFYISAMLPSKNLAEAEKEIIDRIRKIQNEPIATKDIDRIRTKVANRFIFANERPASRANLYGYYYSLFRDLEPAFKYCDRIQALQALDLQEAAREYLNPDAYGVVIIRPETTN